MRHLRLLFLLFLSAPKLAQGYHIAGGDITTQWIGNNNFLLNLVLYRDCSNPSAANFDPTIIVSAYKKANNTLQDTFHIDLNSVVDLTLAGNGCVPPPAVCMQKGEYVRIINLPPLAGGYYLVWERCCRNSTVTNLHQPDQTPMLFYHDVADPALQNSSPVFNSPPLPFTCVGQYFRFNFDATDADGDSLVYELSDPMAGGYTSNQDPNPFSAFNSLGGQNLACPSAPYTATNWAAGFSVSNICGSITPMVIDRQTGLVEGIPDFAGLFAMAVTVYEYRNGILIGQIRREIEFTVIPCTGNNAPNLSASIKDADYEIYETDTLCFSISATDPDGDSIYMYHFGEVFPQSPATGLQPPYALSHDTSGTASVSTDFCWYTTCGQARDSVYHLRYEITDNGCPMPLLAVGKITIKVKDIPKIDRPNLLCLEMNDTLVRVHKSPQPGIVARFFSQFSLYRSTNGAPYQLIRQATDPASLFIDDSLAPDPLNNDYCYFITGTNTCGEVSPLSDTLCTLSQANRKELYLKTVTVNPGDVSIDLVWDDFPDGPYSTYIIERRMNTGNDPWQELIQLSSYTPYSYTDNAVFPDKYSYCYRIRNKDYCENESPNSNESCTILLEGDAGQFSNTLRWNAYSGWAGQVGDYEINRASEGSGYNFYAVSSGPPSLLRYADEDLDPNFGQNNYVVYAHEGSGFLATSRSNEIELVQPPLIYVPNAFTPNGDVKNETWFPKFSFVKEMKVVIYNRWGQEVFQGGMDSSGWDGTFNGRLAAEGVYGFKITFRGFGTSDSDEITGIVSLIR
ncbi:MAG: gliding motility-associated C-terminal domain-containing protein [Bacteroidia bacterium]